MKAQQSSTQVSPMQCVRLLVRDQGPTALWSGLTPYWIQTASKNMVRTTVKDGISYKFPQKSSDTSFTEIMNVVHDLVSGSCAGAAEAALVIVPTDRLRILSMMHDVESTSTKTGKQTLKGPMDHVCHDIKNKGVGNALKNLYQGATPAIVKSSVSIGSRFACQPIFLGWMPALSGKNKGLLEQTLAGGFAGAASAFISHPFDTVKTVMQSQRTNTEAKSMVQTMCQMYRTRGQRCFFAGLSANIASTVVASGVQFATISQLSQWQATHEPVLEPQHKTVKDEGDLESIPETSHRTNQQPPKFRKVTLSFRERSTSTDNKIIQQPRKVHLKQETAVTPKHLFYAGMARNVHLIDDPESDVLWESYLPFEKLTEMKAFFNISIDNINARKLNNTKKSLT